MEAVYFGCPCTVLYRISPITYFLGKPQLRGHIAQPNVVAQREIVPEFLLPRRDGRRVARAAQHLLDDKGAREAQLREFATIRERLISGPRPSEAAADVAIRMID